VNIIETAIPGVLIIEPRVFGDARGFFHGNVERRPPLPRPASIWPSCRTITAARKEVCCAGCISRTRAAGQAGAGHARRGVRCGGRYAAISPTFGKWVGVELSATNKRMFWVPEGFAHGFLTLEDDTDFLYKCTAPYAPAEREFTLAWDDPCVGIEWPLDGMTPLISEKDARAGARRCAGVRMKSSSPEPMASLAALAAHLPRVGDVNAIDVAGLSTSPTAEC
jgi:dTDP-4-dehydrorhamnose 3,5-epimerase